MTAFVSILNQSPKKVDKITILRVVANHVRLHKCEWKSDLIAGWRISCARFARVHDSVTCK